MLPITVAVVFAVLSCCLAAGVRNGGRPGDAKVTAVLVARARRYLLTAAIGQDGARLRVHRLRLGPVARVAGGRGERFSSVLLP